MAFTDLTQKELVAVAEMFGTDVKSTESKASIIGKLGVDGVTYESYLDLVKAVRDEADDIEELTVYDDTPLVVDEVAPVVPAVVVVPEPECQLIKMERKNETYQINGYTFKQSHPYALVKEEDADYLVENIKGFRPANGREIREFYGRD